MPAGTLPRIPSSVQAPRPPSVGMLGLSSFQSKFASSRRKASAPVICTVELPPEVMAMEEERGVDVAALQPAPQAAILVEVRSRKMNKT